MSQDTIESPDGLELRAKPKISARLNKKAVMIVGAVMVGLVLFILANVSKPPPDPTKNVEDSSKKQDFQPAVNSANSITKDIPDQPMLLPAEPPKLGGAGQKGGQVPGLGEPGVDNPSGIPNLGAAPGAGGEGGGLIGGSLPGAAGAGAGGGAGGSTYRSNAPPPSELLREAMYADTVIAKYADGEKTANQQNGLPVKEGQVTARNPADAQREETRPNEFDPNGQSSKEAFLDKQVKRSKKAVEIVNLRQPISEFEIKTGTIIPGVLITPINSDLPGEIVGQVGQNVFDSTTGLHLLIPQGSKLFGNYSSQITFGQERVMVAWNRLIFPNGTTMDINGMAGVDKEGVAGNSDLVNNHYLKIFGYALLSSLFTAAYQISQPPSQTESTTLTTQQTAGAAVGQQLTQLGAKIAEKNLNVQPTLEIRKGFQFNVMVNKDLVFPAAYKP